MSPFEILFDFISNCKAEWHGVGVSKLSIANYEIQLYVDGKTNEKHSVPQLLGYTDPEQGSLKQYQLMQFV